MSAVVALVEHAAGVAGSPQPRDARAGVARWSGRSVRRSTPSSSGMGLPRPPRRSATKVSPSRMSSSIRGWTRMRRLHGPRHSARSWHRPGAVAVFAPGSERGTEVLAHLAARNGFADGRQRHRCHGDGRHGRRRAVADRPPAVGRQPARGGLARRIDAPPDRRRTCGRRRRACRRRSGTRDQAADPEPD